MTVEYVDGVKIMRLHDGAAGSNGDSIDKAMLRIWQMLSGGHAMRDGSVFARQL